MECRTSEEGRMAARKEAKDLRQVHKRGSPQEEGKGPWAALVQGVSGGPAALACRQGALPQDQVPSTGVARPLRRRSVCACRCVICLPSLPHHPSLSTSTGTGNCAGAAH